MKQHNRSFLRMSGLVLVLLLGLSLLVAVASASAAAVPDQAPLNAPSLATLPATTCTLAAGVRTCDFWAKPGTLTMPDGEIVTIWGYADSAGGDAQVPGPIIVANEGETVVVNLTNNLGEVTSMNFPGQAMIPDLVGVGDTLSTSYTFTASNPGTFLYEAGLLPNTQHQVPMGLYGALVVRPSAAANQAYNDLATEFDDEVLLILSEIDPNLNLSPANFDMRDYKPRYMLINGQAYPDTGDIEIVPGAAGARVLLRYINAGLQQHAMGSLGLTQSVIGTNGNKLQYAYSVASETISPGVTADRMVTLPAPSGTDGITRYALYDSNMQLFNNGLEGFGGMLTFLKVVDTPPTDPTGPTTGPVSLVPNPTDGTVDVAVSATIPGATSAEFFIGSPGADGSGVVMSPGAGTDEWTATIFVADMAALLTGDHNIYVHGSNGTWGAYNFAVLHLDKDGPQTTGVSLTPNPSDGSLDVAVSATGNDSVTGNSDIVAAEFWIGAPGSDGGGIPMSLNVVAPIASLDGTIDAATMLGLAEGAHIVSIHSMDEYAQWGDYTTVTLAVDQNGPDTSNVVADPNPNNGSTPYNPTINAIRVDATINDPSSSGVNSNILRAEGYIENNNDAVNNDPGIGFGFPLSPRDGLFNETVEDAYVYIPLSTISALGEGTHTIYIRAQDASGNWGNTDSVDLVITASIPTVFNVVVDPITTNGTAPVTLTAEAVDGTVNIAMAEWFAGVDPGVGNGTAMDATDGFFDSPNEGLTASIDASGWDPGFYTISVRARNAAGSWSATASTLLEVTAAPTVSELLYFSTLGSGINNFVPTVAGPYDDADVYLWNGVLSTFTRVLDARGGVPNLFVPNNADIDAMAYDPNAGPAGGLYYMSMNRNGGTALPGLVGLVQDEDIVTYNPEDNVWELLLVGADMCDGLDAVNGQDIDALDVVNGIVYFSTIGNSPVPAVGGRYDDADIYAYEDGVGCSRVFDASAAGLPYNADIDGLTFVDADTFYVSFNRDGGTLVDGEIIADESVMLYDAGVWTMYFDGTAQGLDSANGQDLDAIDVE